MPEHVPLGTSPAAPPPQVSEGARLRQIAEEAREALEAATKTQRDREAFAAAATSFFSWVFSTIRGQIIPALEEQAKQGTGGRIRVFEISDLDSGHNYIEGVTITVMGRKMSFSLRSPCDPDLVHVAPESFRLSEARDRFVDFEKGKLIGDTQFSELRAILYGLSHALVIEPLFNFCQEQELESYWGEAS